MSQSSETGPTLEIKGEKAIKRRGKNSVRGRRLKGLGKGETRNTKREGRVSLAPKTPFPKNSLSLPF